MPVPHSRLGGIALGTISIWSRMQKEAVDSRVFVGLFVHKSTSPSPNARVMMERVWVWPGLVVPLVFAE